MPFDLPVLLRVLRATFPPRGVSFRHAVVILGFLLAGYIAATARWAFQMLDRVFYPKLAETPVVAPIFVIANPRSGTTFLHRLLSLDEERFTCMTTWQTILPSVTAYAVVRFFTRVDRVVGAPLAKLLHWGERKMFGGWDGVHHVGLNAPEEEQSIFVLTLLDPSCWMMLPTPRSFSDVVCLDDLSEDRRKWVMGLYERALRSHVFAESRGSQTLLSKNVFHAGRMRSILEVFPDARIVHLVRHPYSSLASSSSMFTAPWRFHSPKMPKDHPDRRFFAEVGIEYYRRLHALEPECHERGIPFVTYTYEDVVGDPQGTVEDIYARFDLEMSDAFREKVREIASKARTYKSVHDYELEDFAITRDEVYEAIPEVFEAYGFERDPASL